MKRLFCAVLALFLLFSAAACDSSSGGETVTEKTGAVTRPDLILAENGVSSYVIIRPENASQEEIALSVELRQLFADKFGVDVPLKDDCPSCGKTLFKRSGRGYRKPFCINPECSAFVPEDQRGYHRKKTEDGGADTGAEGTAAEAASGSSAGAKTTPDKAVEKKTAGRKPAARKTAAKKPGARTTAGKKPASSGRSRKATSEDSENA